MRRFVAVVTLSPITPVSDATSRRSPYGAGGATVSTVNENAVTLFAAFGFSSLPVSWWAPSRNTIVSRTQTCEYWSELNVPIDTPSIAIEYEESAPSPPSKNDGVLLRLAVMSEPSCSTCPHVPSSSIAWLSASVPPAGAATKTSARRPEQDDRQK